MTNEVRRAEMLKGFGSVIEAMVKDSTTFKGWKVVLKPSATKLIELNKVRLIAAKVKDTPYDTIHEKGLLECYVVLKRLAKQLNTNSTVTPTETKKPSVSK